MVVPQSFSLMREKMEMDGTKESRKRAQKGNEWLEFSVWVK